MLTDYQATLSNDQALTATASSTNTYDSSAAYDISRGEPLGVMVTVSVAADTGDADETYSFAVVTDDSAAFSTPTTLASLTVPGASLAVGDKVILPFHTGMEQFTRVEYTLGGTTPSVTVTSELKPLCDIETHTTNLPTGYTVSFGS